LELIVWASFDLIIKINGLPYSCTTVSDLAFYRSSLNADWFARYGDDSRDRRHGVGVGKAGPDCAQQGQSERYGTQRRKQERRQNQGQAPINIGVARLNLGLILSITIPLI
jgi:hypothetical protein